MLDYYKMATFASFEYVPINTLKSLIKNYDKLRGTNRELNFDMLPVLKQYLKRAESGKGIIKTEYRPSKRVQDNWERYGRLFVDNKCGLQSFQREIRHTLAGDRYTDYDMKNAHPTILFQYCEKHNIEMPALGDYNANRDAYLDKYGKDFKLRVLEMCFGSGIEDSSPDVLFSLKKEISKSAEFIATFPQNKKIFDIAKKEKPANWLGSGLSMVLNIIENDIVMSAIRSVPQSSSIIPCFDGFLALKSVPINLQELQRLGKEETGYDIKWAIKPMDEAIPVPTRDEDNFDLHTDEGLLDCVVSLAKGGFKINGGLRMVYDITTGLWTSEKISKFYSLVELLIEEPLGVARLDRAWKLSTRLPDEHKFFEEAQEKTRGKLLFEDCIHDITTGELLEKSPDYCFGGYVPHKFPVEKPEGVDDVEKFHFSQPYPDETEYLRWDKAMTMYGLGYGTFIIELGNGQNGKSRRADGIRMAYGKQLVIDMSPDALAVSAKPEAGRASPHLLGLKNARLAFLPELKKGQSLNASLIKTITGGDRITMRGLFKEEETFLSSCALHFIGNGSTAPPLSECEEGAMERRMRMLDSKARYVRYGETDPVNLIYPADDEFVDRVINNPLALIWLLAHTSTEEPPVPKSIVDFSRETIAEQDEVRREFEKLFVRTSQDGDRVSALELCETLGLKARDVASRMVIWGYGKPKQLRIGGKNVNGYSNIKKNNYFVEEV